MTLMAIVTPNHVFAGGGVQVQPPDHRQRVPQSRLTIAGKPSAARAYAALWHPTHPVLHALRLVSAQLQRQPGRRGVGVEGAADALLPVMADDVLSPNALWLRGRGWPGRSAMVWRKL